MSIGIYLFNNSQHTTKSTYKRKVNKPREVNFNPYFNAIVVTTDFDVRMYDCYTGQLHKVQVDNRFISTESEQMAAFSMGALYRKYFICDKKGRIHCFNHQNGQKFRELNEPKDDAEIPRKFADCLNLKSSQVEQAIPSEEPVTAILYLYNENRLIVGTKHSVIKIFDENLTDGNPLVGVSIVQKDSIGWPFGF